MMSVYGRMLLTSSNSSLCHRCIRQINGLPTTYSIFDRRTKIKQKDYAASQPTFLEVCYVKDEFGSRLADRVFDVKRTFPIAIDIGCGRGHVSKHFTDDMIDTLVLLDTSQENLDKAALPEGDIKILKIQGDEGSLPFKSHFADLVVSCLGLHWINDLPGTLSTIRQILKPDGVFIGSIFSGETLFELRSSLLLAETEREGGFSPHISPFVRPSDVAGLLTQAGFNLITVDMDEIVVRYPSMFELLFDLQAMGESNCNWNRRLHLPRETMLAAASIYREMYAKQGTTEGHLDGVPATFEVVSFIGWRPDPSQPKPIKRGSAEFSLKDIPNLDNIAEKTKDLS